MLRAVYVAGGFTAPDLADKIFTGPAVRARGALITARDPVSEALLGLIILVPPGGASRQIATASEAEVHLLAVLPAARRRGIARALIDALLSTAAARGYSPVLLSTQENMDAAHSLYRGSGFERTPDRDWVRGGRNFLTYRFAPRP